MPVQATISTSLESNPDADKKRTGTHPKSHHDTTREIFETIVFVVVLVLMLKLFVAEAFVIPTGSMASTLWGDQVVCTCRECGHKFPVNAMSDGNRSFPKMYICENCGIRIDDEKKVREDSTSVSSGDRVLVSKYEYHLHEPHRFDVPVFKYPREPFKASEFTSMNYIKRLVGLGGETIAVFNGDLYATRDLTYDYIPADKRPQRETEARWGRYMYPDDQAAMEYFRQGKFEIVRKEPKEILAMRRIVFNLDNQPKSVEGIRRVRWHPAPNEEAGWAIEAAGFKHSGAELGWARYQHIDPWNVESVTPHYIVDYLSYNTREDVRPFMRDPKDHWVSDLILDCTVEFPAADSQVILELAKGRNRCQAIFAGGECKLVRITETEAGKEERHEMGSHATKIAKGGKYALRFANVDARLTVWVDDTPIPFGKDQTDYPPPDPTKPLEPFEKHDLLQPARIGAQGDVTVSKVSLWRDLHYRCGDVSLLPEGSAKTEEERKDVEKQNIQALKEWGGQLPTCGSLQTYYVQPGHYLMFGDNVNSSADSRWWGLVPQRLMLGRAIVVYWPPTRIGVIE